MGNKNLYGVSYYTDLLKATYSTIKNVNPSAVVIGGVTSTVDKGFISGILSNGGYNDMTSVSVHPYTNPSSAEVGNPGWYTIASAVNNVNQTFPNYGAPKKIWMSEFGWSTIPKDVDEPRQAAYTARAFASGLANSQAASGVSKMCYYDFVNDGNEPTNKGKELNYGLLNTWSGVEVPYSAKQAYVSYNAATTTLQGATYVSSTDIDRVRMIKGSFTRSMRLPMIWT
jgi:hypothetical protein